MFAQGEFRMHWKRSAFGLLLGGGLSIFSVGCAAVEALVSSPAGQSAQVASPQRIAAIGRVFENQGHYAQAQVMYRRVLSADPKNVAARERLDHIASMRTKRSFNSSSQDTRSALAVADSLKSTTRHSGRLQETRLTADVEAAAVDAAEVLRRDREAVFASLPPAAIEAAQANPADAVPEPAAISEPELQPVTANNTETQSAPTEWKLDTPTAPDTAEVTLTFAPAAKVSDIATVGFDGRDQQIATIASMESAWKAASRLVTLDQLLEWSEAPADNQENLLFALTSGEDDGVKALAAAILAECSRDNTEINAALEEVCGSGSDLVRVSAQDALMQRGCITEDGVADLLSLLMVTNSEIRGQAAASLRNCAGSQWAAACVSGLSELLTDEDPSVVAIVAATLGDFGSEASPCRGQLTRIVSTSDDELTVSAANLALNRIPVQDLTPVPVRSSPEEAEAVNQYLPVAE